MIEMRAVSSGRQGCPVLRELSLSVRSGESFGLLGRNGAGKSTSLRILATLQRPDAGSALVGGFDVVANRREVRSLVGYLPDFFGVYELMSAAEYLEYFAGCHGVPRSRWKGLVADLLELVGLPRAGDLRVETLSRGMRQRLGIARALVHDPQVLLLDDPASGLDARARADFAELVQALIGMRKTVVISGHVLGELELLCTYFGIVDDGRLIASGTSDSLVLGAEGSTEAPTTLEEAFRRLTEAQEPS